MVVVVGWGSSRKRSRDGCRWWWWGVGGGPGEVWEWMGRMAGEVGWEDDEGVDVGGGVGLLLLLLLREWRGLAGRRRRLPDRLKEVMAAAEGG